MRFLLLSAIAALSSAGLLVYSQTVAFAWDEGFHLVAAQLIAAGRRPYLDFFFPQTALNAYWTAGWMKVLGVSWHTAHAAAALMTAAAIALTADFLFRRFPAPQWRLGAAVAGALAIGLNVMVVEFGTIGQAYGFCLFLIVAAFRLSVAAAGREGLAHSLGGGFFAGAAAASSLLTAPVAPILILWILIYNRAGQRWKKFAVFAAGALLPFLPLLWLFVQSPRRVVFNVIDYHLFYRQVAWAGAIPHDIGVMLSWIYSSQASLLGLLAIGGWLWVARRSEWTREQKSEYHLCAWLAAALAIHISSAHPTFERYYLLAVPFLGILAVAAVYAISSRLYSPDRTLWPVVIVAVLFSSTLAKALYDERDDFTWHDFEQIAQKVNEVTPPGSLFLADEHVYFLMRRLPPPGMELADAHKLELPAKFAEWVHIIPGPELKRQVKAGVYSSVETCDDEERINALGLPQIYVRRADIGDCTVFWSKKP